MSIQDLKKKKILKKAVKEESKAHEKTETGKMEKGEDSATEDKMKGEEANEGVESEMPSKKFKNLGKK